MEMNEEELAERNAEIFAMALHNMSCKEIAEVVGVSDSRVRQILTRWQRWVYRWRKER